MNCVTQKAMHCIITVTDSRNNRDDVGVDEFTEFYKFDSLNVIVFMVIIECHQIKSHFNSRYSFSLHNMIASL